MGMSSAAGKDAKALDREVEAVRAEVAEKKARERMEEVARQQAENRVSAPGIPRA